MICNGATNRPDEECRTAGKYLKEIVTAQTILNDSHVSENIQRTVNISCNRNVPKQARQMTMVFILQIGTDQYCGEKTSPRQMEFDTGVNG